MYALSKIVDVKNEIDLPTSMYKMNPIYSIGGISNPEQKCEGKYNGPDKGMKELEERQKSILEKLSNLKSNVFSMLSSQSTEEIKNKRDGIVDLVISASPNNPPYSLLAIKKVWSQNSISIYSTASDHSSLKGKTDPKLREVFNDSFGEKRGQFDYGFTVQFKQCLQTSLMVNPLAQSLIVGEANVLRYMSRISPVQSLNYELSKDTSLITKIDHWLDFTQTNLLEGNTKMRQSFLKQLNAMLGSKNWIIGEAIGICDIFVWSVLLQLKLSNANILKDASSNVKTWLNRVNSYCDAKGL